MSNTEKIFSGSDMVLTTRSKGGAMAGGFLISTIGSQSVNTDDNKKGGGLISTLKDLAVPAGLFYAATKVGDTIVDKKDAGVIEDKVYENLLKSAEHKSSANNKASPKKKSKTRRSRKSSSKKSRKKKS